MKRLLQVLILTILFIFSYSENLISQDLKWVKEGNGWDFYNITMAAVHAPHGYIYTAGHFTTDIDFGDTTLRFDGENHLFLAKHDSTGKVLWAKIIGATGANHYYDKMELELDDFGNVYLMGNTGYQRAPVEGHRTEGNLFYIIKYTSDGKPMWVKSYAKGDYHYDRTKCNAMEIHGDRIYVVGEFDRDLILGNFTLKSTNYYTDVFLCTMDLAGNIHNAVRYGGDEMNSGNDIKVSDDGEVYVSGNDIPLLKFNAEGNLLSDARVDEYDYRISNHNLGLDSSGNIYLYGTFSTDLILGNDTIEAKSAATRIILIKFDKNLKKKWFLNSDGGVSSLGSALATDRNGTSYIATDVYKLIFEKDTVFNGLSVTQIDSSGKLTGIANYDVYDGFVKNIVIGRNGRYYLAGSAGRNTLLACFMDTLINNEAWRPISDFKPDSVSSTAIKLVWKAKDSNVTGFTIERSYWKNKLFKPIAYLDANERAYIDKNLIPFTTYYYRIKATSKQGFSKYSSVLEIKTANDIPKAPTTYSFPSLPDYVNVWWFDNSNNETSFVVEISEEMDTNFKHLVTVLHNITHYRVEGLKSNATYYFRVKAANELGSSEFTAPIPVLTYPAKPLKPVGPEKVQNISKSVYKTDHLTDISYQWKLIPESAGEIVKMSESIIEVSWNQSYVGEVQISLTASNASGVSGESEPLVVKIGPPLDKPEKPSGDTLIFAHEEPLQYSVSKVKNASYYKWKVFPEEAGTISSAENNVALLISEGFSGLATISVSAGNEFGESIESDPLNIRICAKPARPGKPSGDLLVCDKLGYSNYKISENDSVGQYAWKLSPAEAGALVTDGANVRVKWAEAFFGEANIAVKLIHDCGESEYSEFLEIFVHEPLPINLAILGEKDFCQNETRSYRVNQEHKDLALTWKLSPPEAGEIMGTGQAVEVNWASDFYGRAILNVSGQNKCGIVQNKEVFEINIKPKPSIIDLAPVGETTVCNKLSSFQYSIPATDGIKSYFWNMTPSSAGVFSSEENKMEVFWNSNYSGEVQLTVVTQFECGTSTSKPLNILIYENDELPALVGEETVCTSEEKSEYFLSTNKDDVRWEVFPAEAGSVEGSATSAAIYWNKDFDGEANLKATYFTSCREVNSVAFNILREVCNKVDSGSNIFPNPSAGIVTLQKPENEVWGHTVEVLTNDGKLVKEYPTSKKLIQIDLSGNPGLYFLKIKINNKTVVKKVIVR